MAESTPKPSVCRIVHFVLPSGDCRPAIVTRVHADGRVNLQVLTDADDPYPPIEGLPADRFRMIDRGRFWSVKVDQDEEGVTPGTWHWPQECQHGA